MKTHGKESVLFILLMVAFTPLAFLLMPVIAVVFVVLAVVMMLMGLRASHHGLSE